MDKQVHAVDSDTKFDINKITNYTKGDSDRLRLTYGYSNKPQNCFWTSSLYEDSSDWLDWCRFEDFKAYDYAIVIIPKKDAKVYVIDTLEDLVKVSNLYEGYHEPGRINFPSLLMAGYDGVRVTKNAAMDLHSYSTEGIYNLNAWDCESTVWFNNKWIESYEIHRVEDYKII